MSRSFPSEASTLPKESIDPILGVHRDDDPPTHPALRVVGCPKCRGEGVLNDLIESDDSTYEMIERVCDFCGGAKKVGRESYIEFQVRNEPNR